MNSASGGGSDSKTQTFFIPQLFHCSRTADHTIYGTSKIASAKPTLYEQVTVLRFAAWIGIDPLAKLIWA